MKNKYYSARRQPKDCWNARLLQNTKYSSKWEFPLFPCTQAVPTTLKSFRYVNPNTEDSNWIHFMDLMSILKMYGKNLNFGRTT